MPRHELESFYKEKHNACRYVLRLTVATADSGSCARGANIADGTSARLAVSHPSGLLFEYPRRASVKLEQRRRAGVKMPRARRSADLHAEI